MQKPVICLRVCFNLELVVRVSVDFIFHSPRCCTSGVFVFSLHTPNKGIVHIFLHTSFNLLQS